MKLLLLSDAHFGRDLHYPTPSNENYSVFGSKFPLLFEKLFPRINNFDLFINLGDCIAGESPEKDFQTYNEFINHFKEIKLPVYHIIGNHDGLNLTRNQLMSITKQPNNYFSFDLNGFHHIILDSKWEKGYPKAIDSEQIDWLKNDLKKTNNESIVYLHYACDEQNLDNNAFFSGKEYRAFIEQKKDLRKIFEDSSKVNLVVFGHTHFFHSEKIKNITYLNVPSFTQNDGNGDPCGLYLEVEVNPLSIDVEMKNIRL